MKESRLGHSCDNCGQRIAFFTPEAAEELFGSLFLEATFLRLSALDFRNPDREVAEYWHCSDYCARDHIENRINDQEEQRRRELQANQLVFSFFFRGVIQSCISRWSSAEPRPRAEEGGNEN